MEETISLEEIFDMIKRRLKLIITIAVIAVLLTFVYSFFIVTPIYQAKAQFIVTQKDETDKEIDSGTIRTNVELINTYKEIITSNAIMDDVLAELNLDMSPNKLAQKITVKSSENSQVVNIEVTDADVEKAVDIANVTSVVFQEKVPSLMNVDNVHILSEAVVLENHSPISPNKKLNLAIGLVLGLMLGVGLAFLLEYLDKKIRTSQDIENITDIPQLGVICMCQVILGRLITPIFLAFYFCTLFSTALRLLTAPYRLRSKNQEPNL